MPMLITKMTTPKGHDIVRMESSGGIVAADAEAMTKLLAHPDFADRAILALVDHGARFSPEARQTFTKTNTKLNAKPVAIVVSSAPLRVMLSFIIRMSGVAATTRFFSSETDAMAFIEEKLDAQK